MTKRGWIKVFRREQEWLKELSNAEVVYLLAARIATEWNSKIDYFGTFDARIKEMKKLLGWSDGTISRVGNLLLGKGVLQKTEDCRRLRITNAELFFSKGNKGKEVEKIILDVENNLHKHELNIQVSEYFPNKVKQKVKGLYGKMRLSGQSKKKN